MVQSTSSPSSSFPFRSSIELMSSIYSGTVSASGALSLAVVDTTTSSSYFSQSDFCVVGSHALAVKSDDPSATLDHIGPASTCVTSTVYPTSSSTSASKKLRASAPAHATYGSVRSVSPNSAPSATLSLPSSVSSLAEVSPSSSLSHAANTSVSIRTKANAKLLKRNFLNIIKTFLLQSNNNYFSDHSSTNRLDAE